LLATSCNQPKQKGKMQIFLPSQERRGDFSRKIGTEMQGETNGGQRVGGSGVGPGSNSEDTREEEGGAVTWKGEEKPPVGGRVEDSLHGEES